ncbi:MAG: hypothetical protein AB7S86_17165 [Hydrogenophaga sp.]|uniref:hypothetical protein n=1 Tax=Hydrogenophaga sp. TaxID=1904254 RepID=UPI003D10CEE6
MHNAPSVTYPVGRCRFFAVLLSMLGLAGLWVLILWWVAASPASVFQQWEGWGGLTLGMAWGLWAAIAWRGSPRGGLTWDAHAPAASLSPEEARGAWRWRDSVSVEAVRLAGVDFIVDLQILALLRLHGAQQSPRWVWVERWRKPEHWNDLRRALQSSSA